MSWLLPFIPPAAREGSQLGGAHWYCAAPHEATGGGGGEVLKERPVTLFVSCLALLVDR
jgi:hypothetical protein